MAFSPPVVGCLVKKGLQKGGSRAPQDPPLATPLPALKGLTLETIALPPFYSKNFTLIKLVDTTFSCFTTLLMQDHSF